MSKTVTKDGQKYVVFENGRAVPVDENGVAQAEVEKDQDGNVTVKVPCFKVAGKANKPNQN